MKPLVLSYVLIMSVTAIITPIRPNIPHVKDGSECSNISSDIPMILMSPHPIHITAPTPDSPTAVPAGFDNSTIIMVT